MHDPPRPPYDVTSDLVLVGGGHAHVQVLKAFAMRPLAGVRVTIVVDTPIAVYSGMVPGYVAGQYEQGALEIDVLPLARMAGARVIIARATGVNAEREIVRLEGRPPLPYDVLSLDIGSSVAGLDVPGVVEHSIPTRPIGRFVRRVSEWEGSEAASPQVLVVGAGAGGVELAFALNRRLCGDGARGRVTLLEAGERILSTYPAALAKRVAQAAQARNIDVRTGATVTKLDADAAHVSGTQLPFDVMAWVAGAAPHRDFDSSSLPTDDVGFLLTRSTLQLRGLDNVFAVGDCATLADHRWVPKAGVYAVRQGPVLVDNLRRMLDGLGGRLREYKPQTDFLTLLNLGDGTAIGAKWGRSFEGAWVMRLKDRIDRRFMTKFQALSERHEVNPAFGELAKMRAEMDMVCGGCAAKLGRSELGRALDRLEASHPLGSAGTGGDADAFRIDVGIAEGDDAAVYGVADGPRIVSSVDQFRALTDDPYLVGRIGAVNAASDVFAKGVRPAVAQAVIALPEAASSREREEVLYQVLAGAGDAFRSMEIALAGGHTTTATELLVGFHIEGFLEPGTPLLALSEMASGGSVVLTKALGTGVLFHADMKGRVRGPWYEAAVTSMLRSNGEAVEIAKQHGATAATDVTGFGLAEHLAAMARASQVTAHIFVDALPTLPGVKALLDAGLRSTFHETNARAERGMAIEAAARAHPLFPSLFDPQTSGGLLFAVDVGREQAVVHALHRAGYPDACVIGRTLDAEESPLRVSVTSD